MCRVHVCKCMADVCMIEEEEWGERYGRLRPHLLTSLPGYSLIHLRSSALLKSRRKPTSSGFVPLAIKLFTPSKNCCVFMCVEGMYVCGGRWCVEEEDGVWRVHTCVEGTHVCGGYTCVWRKRMVCGGYTCVGEEDGIGYQLLQVCQLN